MKALVVMNAEGRLTLPASIRREIGVTGDSPFEVEVVDGNVLLRPAVVVPREDAWAYTAEHRALVARARADVAAGKVLSLDEPTLERHAD